MSACGDGGSFEVQDIIEIDEFDQLGENWSDLAQISDSLEHETVEAKIRCDLPPTGGFVATEEGWLFISETLEQGCVSFQLTIGPHDYYHLNTCNLCEEPRELHYWWLVDAPLEGYQNPAVSLPFYSQFSFDGVNPFSASVCSRACNTICDMSCPPSLCATEYEVETYTLMPGEAVLTDRGSFWLPFETCPADLDACDGRPYDGTLYYDLGLPLWQTEAEEGRIEHSDWALCDALGLDPEGVDFLSSADNRDWRGEGIDWHRLVLDPPAELYNPPLCPSFYCNDLRKRWGAFIDIPDTFSCSRRLVDANLGAEVCQFFDKVKVIANANDNSTATKLIDQQRHWIGLRRDGESWRWSDGLTLSDTGYSNWAEGEPSFDGDCVIIDGEGQWHVKNCTDSYAVLCQY